MASIITKAWAGSSSPQARLNVTQISSTNTTVTYSWSVEYVAKGYAAYTNGQGRNFWAKIDGTTVVNSYYNINGVSSTVTIASGTHTVNKTTSSRNISIQVAFYFDVTWSGYYAGSLSASGSISVPAKPSYTVSYNANGGDDPPSSQTKWYGTNLTLSSSTPARNGYAFKGWATSATGSVVYAAGATYSANASVTLYAVWQRKSYTITYNANGGTGAPGSQTKIHNEQIDLSSVEPTRTKYKFLGWGLTASSTTVLYEPGDTYLQNRDLNLYAIWELTYVKPMALNLTIDRCDASGVLDDEGSYTKVKFDWETSEPITDCYIEWSCSEKSNSVDSYHPTVSGESGSIDQVVGNGLIDPNYTWDFTIHLQDSLESTNISIRLSSTKYLIDLLAGGGGIAFGKAASKEGLDIGMDEIHLYKSSVVLSENTPFLKFQNSGRPTIANHIGLANGTWLQGQVSPTGNYVNILRINESGQIELNWTSGGLKGRVMKQIYAGTLSEGGSVTSSDFPYYNLFILKFSNGPTSAFEDITAIGILDRSDKTGLARIRFFGGSRGTNGSSATIYDYTINGQLIEVRSTSLTSFRYYNAARNVYKVAPWSVYSVEPILITGIWGVI